MCGIFGYVGDDEASKIIINGLKRLEYRGYDSWGIALLDENDIKVTKRVGEIGEIDDVKDLGESHIGIGHTRWATHGGVTKSNAHPHYATDGSFVLAQNGIVENYQELKKELKSLGYEFNTETDTEVIVRLVEYEKSKGADILTSVKNAFSRLDGRNTIIILTRDEHRVIAIRDGSPLVVGVGEDEIFLASDTLSFANKTDKVVYVDNNQLVDFKDKELKIYNLEKDEEVDYEVKELDHADVEINKEGYDHFMHKEIVEQQHTIRESTQYTESEFKPLIDDLRKAKNVYTVGAGTASFAAAQIAYYLREYASINAIALKSYEIESYEDIFSEGDIMLAVSQSGETTDTIEALEKAQEKGVKIASLVNMVGSTITRMSDHAYLSRSGPEICVASTKAFTAQISWGLLLAKTMVGEYEDTQRLIHDFSNDLGNYFTDDLYENVKSIVDDIIDQEHFFVLGKGQNFQISLEGALKVKEITYKHFEGFAAGELKHGVIALIEDDIPVFVIVSEDENKSDMLTAAAEVKARGAKVIGIAKEENELFDHFINTIDAGIEDPASNVIPFQLISYFMGIALGNSPDKPRNLAKSVTVK